MWWWWCVVSVDVVRMAVVRAFMVRVVVNVVVMRMHLRVVVVRVMVRVIVVRVVVVSVSSAYKRNTRKLVLVRFLVQRK